MNNENLEENLKAIEGILADMRKGASHPERPFPSDVVYPHNHFPTSVVEVASRFEGTKEVRGNAHNAQIVAMLELDSSWAHKDEIPWCSAFVNYVAFLLGLERTKSLRARSWLRVGTAVDSKEALPGDIVIFSRGSYRPGPEVIAAPGHVGIFLQTDPKGVLVLGGNQGNAVSRKHYSLDDVLGVRRLSVVNSG